MTTGIIQIKVRNKFLNLKNKVIHRPKTALFLNSKKPYNRALIVIHNALSFYFGLFKDEYGLFKSSNTAFEFKILSWILWFIHTIKPLG